MRLPCLTVLLYLLWTASVAAQLPEELRGLRVVDVNVVGEAAGRIDQRELGVPLGAPLSRALVRGAIRRLSRSGRWADIQVDVSRAEGGVLLWIHLAPRLVAERVDIVGNDELDDRELARLLEVRAEQPIERERIPDWVQAIEERYDRAGYREAQVRVMLRDTVNPSRKVLRVEVTEGPATRIARLIYVGDPLPKRKGLRRAFGLRRGDVADRDAVEAAVKRAERQLRTAGYYGARFGEPAYTFRGRAADVRVPSTVGPRYEVQLSGVEPLKRSEVFEALALGAEPLTGAAGVAALKARVLDLYRRLGFNDVRVDVWLVPAPDEDSPALLRVKVEQGTQLEVVAVSFPGAAHFRQRYLREQLYSYLEEDLPGSTVARPVDDHVADQLGFGGQRRRRERTTRRPLTVDPRRIYYPPTYEEAIEHLRELYRAQGYLRVQVGPVQLRDLQGAAADEAELRGVRGALAVVPVVEGPRTFVYDVRVEQNEQLTTRQALRALALPRGKPFSYLALEEARVRLLDAYRERGFFYARAEPRVSFSDDGTRAEIRFEIVERFQVRVGAIEVRGAERSNERMIRNRLFLEVGELYRPSLERKSKEALDDLDVFSTVAIAPDEIDLPARVKTVIVTVSEQRTQQLESNAGFSTGEGARGGFGYRYKNLFGSALRAELRGELGYQFVFLDSQIQERFEALQAQEGVSRRVEYQATLAFGIPYIPHLPRLQSTVDLVVMQDLQRDFRLQKEGISWNLFYKPVRRLTLSLSEGLEESTFQLLGLLTDEDCIGSPRNITPQSLVPEGDNTLLSTKLAAAWDGRDPSGKRFGLLLSAGVEYATTINERLADVGDQAEQEDAEVLFQSNLFRLNASAEFLVPFARSLAVVINPRWGRIVHFRDSQAYPNRRFYLGGVNFRGYQQNAMIPQDLQDEVAANRAADAETEDEMDPQQGAEPDPLDPASCAQGVDDPNDIVSRGGETFLVVQSEFRFPLIGDLQGALLMDVGNVWANPRAIDLRPEALDVTVGFGVRIDMTVALLALDLGIRLGERDPGDQSGFPGAFQFSFRSQ